MKRVIFAIAGLALISAFFIVPGLSRKEIIRTASVQKNTQQPDTTNTNVVEYTIKPGDTFASAMGNLGIAYNEAEKIIRSSAAVYDFAQLHAGNLLKVNFINTALAQVSYDINSSKSVVVEKVGGDFQAREDDIQYDVEQASASATITSSLFEDASRAGLEAKTIMELADVFSWDIDFATDIKEGDSFKIVYEKRSRDGKPADPGRILAAQFENDGKTFSAFFYNGKYYDAEGQSLARQFLKSPLNYSYISSGFSYNRLHPVLKVVLPHRAIDYAAPAGTPIVATADGDVVYAGWKGEYGIYVGVKHNGAYSTQYAHLSSIAKGIKKGARVVQGQVVGYVGSTGISTGPHLQYSMTKDGTLINPLTLEPPRDASISAAEREDFNRMRDGLEKLIES